MINRNPFFSWAVMICLVGLGQDIYDGEVGINEWFKVGIKQYKNWEDKSNQLNARINALLSEKIIQKGKKERMLASIELMSKEPDSILRWNKEAWMAMVENAIVHIDKTISFNFYCGRTIKV